MLLDTYPSSWPWAHWVTQAGLKLVAINRPALVFGVLEVQASTTYYTWPVNLSIPWMFQRTFWTNTIGQCLLTGLFSTCLMPLCACGGHRVAVEWFLSSQDHIGFRARILVTSLTKQKPLSTEPVVLSLWVLTPLWGCVKRPFHRSCSKTIGKLRYLRTIQNSSKISYEVAMNVILWLGVITTGGTVLKGCGIWKVENHCPELSCWPSLFYVQSCCVGQPGLELLVLLSQFLTFCATGMYRNVWLAETDLWKQETRLMVARTWGEERARGDCWSALSFLQGWWGWFRVKGQW